MEHASLPKELRFTLDDDAENLFAKLDYALRDGVHIQRSTDPDLSGFCQMIRMKIHFGRTTKNIYE